jgi:hypothetical protein
MDPREGFGSAVSVYLRSLYPVDTEAHVLADMQAAGYRGKTTPGVVQILEGTLDARAIDELLGTYRMAIVVGAAELLLGETVETYLARRAAAGEGAAGREVIGFEMLQEALVHARARTQI